MAAGIKNIGAIHPRMRDVINPRSANGGAR
jgi:hypothetical protein